MDLLSRNDIYNECNIDGKTLNKMIEQGLHYEEEGKRKLFVKKDVDDFVENKRNEFLQKIAVGEEYNNNYISTLFGGNYYRGMKKINIANMLVLLSSTKEERKTLYSDYWNYDTFYYTGMGVEGDQKLDFFENKTLANSNLTKTKVVLFEQILGCDYIYRGEVQLVGIPFQEEEETAKGETRLVWKFPLKLVGNGEQIEKTRLDKQENIREQKARKISNAILRKRAEKISNQKTNRKRYAKSEVYDRDENVKEYALRRANGICELCLNKGPFEVDGRPFLEVHHIKWLSKGGEDTIENVAALCPNCHRKMHKLNEQEDIEIIIENVKKDEADFVVN